MIELNASERGFLGCLYYTVLLPMILFAISVTLPACLFCLHNNEFIRTELPGTLAVLHYIGLIFVFPGALIFSVLLSFLFNREARNGASLKRMLALGCVYGVVASWLNLPIHFLIPEILHSQLVDPFRLFVLHFHFLVRSPAQGGLVFLAQASSR